MAKPIQQAPDSARSCCDAANAGYGVVGVCGCGFVTCVLHSYVGEDGRSRCFHCLADLGFPDARDASAFGSSVVAGPHVLIVLHALHVCGAARHCLELAGVFKGAGRTVTVLALSGGGHWGNRFLARADRVVVVLGSKFGWADLTRLSGVSEFEFVSAHYDPAIRWAIDQVPPTTPLFSHFHTRPLPVEGTQTLLATAAARSSGVLFPCKETLASYASLIAGDPATSKSQVMPNAAPSLERPRRSISRSSVTRGGRIAVVSRLDDDKLSLPLLIETVREVRATRPAVEVVVAGPGERAEATREALKGTGLNGAVKLLGYVDRIEEVYNWCDVVFLPSHTECMPYAALEAECFGRACVMPAIGFATTQSRDHPLVRTFAPADARAAAALLLDELAAPKRDRTAVLPQRDRWVRHVRTAYRLES